ncbi:MAG: hypothetical protein ACTSRS_15120 [Candidatus Helarchaeota archaeon]
MSDFVVGIILSIFVGIGMSTGGILVRIGAKKFRGNLLPKYKQNLLLGLQITFLNLFFTLGAMMSLISTVGKIAAPMIGNTTIAITIIYSTSYVSTILIGNWLLKEGVNKLELLAVGCLILAIVFVSFGTLLATGAI